MEIIEIKNGSELLKNFLSENQHLIFHTFNYKKFIEDAFNIEYRKFALVENKKIKLVLPIVEVKSGLFGNKVISSAYLEYGGFCGNVAYVNGVLDHLEKIFSKDYDYLEVRGGQQLFDAFDAVLSSRLIKQNLYKRFVLPLADEETVWKNIQKSKRKAIKKSLKSVGVKEIPFSDLAEFYHLYCRNMRSFGSPPYSKKYFISFYKNIVETGLGKIYGTYHQEKLISALLGFTYHDRVHIIIAVSDEKYHEFRPNDAVHWHFIKWACSNGYKLFDFGRVREESGQYEYKRKWGPQLLELPSYFMLWKTKSIPTTDPEAPKYQFAVKLWKKMPLWFTKLVGPYLRKRLGI